MPRLRAAVAACAFALASALAAVAAAQDSREAQQRLEKLRGELKTIAGDRRRLEGERGAAARALRRADEQVAASARRLAELDASIAREREALAGLRLRRAQLDERLSDQRAALAALLRAAYTVGDAAALKLLLAQDRVADGQRLLAWHGYLQRDRARRIAALARELEQLAAVEREIGERSRALDQARDAQQRQLAQLEADRKARASTLAQLEARYRDRRQREQALGRDARALEQLLTRLRAAAARAERERRAAAARAAAARSSGAAPATPAAAPAAAGPAISASLGWPLSGTLVSGYGSPLPGGRRSEGVTIAAAAGTEVRAVADGKVVFADWMNGYGLILIVDHGNGLMSLYAHNDALLRDPGDSVRRGDPVARVGTSGGQGRPALYFELRRDGRPVDPGGWLQRR
ncbi:MAG: murein hydrolase activator EnvC family protein [Gammaproteobacteria bacterium]